MRKIIHIDMDAFYASIEQRDNPDYRGKPLAVGYSGDRGVVAAASYEARKYGIRSAMPSKTARAKCPELIFVDARIDVYKAVSAQIKEIFLEYTDTVETLSLDEAYLDVTVNKKRNPSATKIAREIKKRIKEKTGLTASAGVSVNKFLAKIASDTDKPDGLFVITDKQAEKFAENLKIESFWGIGKVTAAKMHKMGIWTGKDIKKAGEAKLIKIFGKAGHIYYQNAHALDEREVKAGRARKSLGAETTFLSDINDKKELNKRLMETAEELWRRVSENKFEGSTVTLKIKYSDFRRMTRSKTAQNNIENYETFLAFSNELLKKITENDEFQKRKIRLIGLTLENKKIMEKKQLNFEFEELF